MEQETTLLSEKVMWYKKALQAFPGQLTITNKNITFSQDRVSTPGTGLLGSLLARNSKKVSGGELLNAPLSEVKFKKGKTMGSKSYILEVSTNNDEVFKFMFDDSMLSKVDSVVKPEI